MKTDRASKKTFCCSYWLLVLKCSVRYDKLMEISWKVRLPKFKKVIQVANKPIDAHGHQSAHSPIRPQKSAQPTGVHLHLTVHSVIPIRRLRSNGSPVYNGAASKHGDPLSSPSSSSSFRLHGRARCRPPLSPGSRGASTSSSHPALPSCPCLPGHLPARGGQAGRLLRPPLPRCDRLGPLAQISAASSRPHCAATDLLSRCGRLGGLLPARSPGSPARFFRLVPEIEIPDCWQGVVGLRSIYLDLLRALSRHPKQATWAAAVGVDLPPRANVDRVACEAWDNCKETPRPGSHRRDLRLAPLFTAIADLPRGVLLVCSKKQRMSLGSSSSSHCRAAQGPVTGLTAGCKVGMHTGMPLVPCPKCGDEVVELRASDLSKIPRQIFFKCRLHEKDMEQTAPTLVEQVGRLKTELDRVKEEVEALQSRIAFVTADVQGLKNALGTLDVKCSKLISIGQLGLWRMTASIHSPYTEGGLSSSRNRTARAQLVGERLSDMDSPPRVLAFNDLLWSSTASDYH
ncbi:hypothetical protein U9M48_001898 [Paspalum notatum var. saurae]|uniref:Uncharacterized protein n=1 Tax=Paspalum notatum var. saurae TaxID=547442 RepID=A0AAQ3PIX4_PASNO